MHKNLVGALDKSEDLEKQKDAEELARQKRSEQRSQNEIIRREERLKEECVRGLPLVMHGRVIHVAVACLWERAACLSIPIPVV